MRIRWIPARGRRPTTHLDYLRETKPNLARSTIIEIRKAVRSLKRLPHRGRLGREPGTRELLHIRLPHIVAYRIEEDAVEVLRIWHPAKTARSVKRTSAAARGQTFPEPLGVLGEHPEIRN